MGERLRSNITTFPGVKIEKFGTRSVLLYYQTPKMGARPR
jgi:hypothetical protein